MKLKIITIHCIPNFGSVFQSYALVKFLQNQGYDAELIDYRPNYFFKGRNIIKKILGVGLNYYAYKRQSQKYNDFIDIYLPKGELYHSLEELKELSTKNTIYISGGDQIWNTYHPCGKDDAYKLTFVKGVKKIAFGTSMGRNTFSNEELVELSKKVSDFCAIGLREKTTVGMLQPYLKIPVYHVADPVLLLEKKDYLSFIGTEPLIKTPYLVMYLADRSDLLTKTINYVAKKRGLKVVHVCGFRKKCECDFFLKDTGPKDVLNLIFYSKFVVSASFHATLFSILFHKEFCTLLPGKGTNTRIEDLLDYFDLSQRIVQNEEDLCNLDKNIDFKKIDVLRNDLVVYSKKQLLSNFE